MGKLDEDGIRRVRTAIEFEDAMGDGKLARALTTLLEGHEQAVDEVSRFAERLAACEALREAAEARVADADMIVFADRAARDVIRERRRQVEMGRDAQHDDKHTEGELLSAGWGAICRLTAAWAWLRSGLGDGRRRDVGSRRYRELLVESAALTLAEIERIDRAQQSET